MSKTARLAEALLADRNRVAEPTGQNIIACRSCGSTFVYRGRRGELNGNFCSMRCQDWYDGGNAPGEPDTTTLRGWKVIAGPPGVEIGSDYYTGILGREPIPMRRGKDGFYIACKHCNKEFESIGLRCCSTECERGLRERQENLAIMADAGIEPAAKRTCETCGARIPTWRNGRKVSSATRFCSSKCGAKARRAA
jgi:hypothetical protein